MPKGFEKFFPDLNQIAIVNSKLKAISKSDLIPFKNLTDLILYQNQIEVLENDLFERNLLLKMIDFESNKLQYIGENTLTPLTKLESADFELNPCISLSTSSLLAIQISKMKADIKLKCTKRPSAITCDEKLKDASDQISDFQTRLGRRMFELEMNQLKLKSTENSLRMLQEKLADKVKENNNFNTTLNSLKTSSEKLQKIILN
jgi:hypothetical protein